MLNNTNDKNHSIWLHKNIKPRAKELEKQASKGQCYMCHAHCPSYCNSHSIPRFILKNLSKDGEYSSFAAVSNADFHKSKIGRNKAGTFRLICRRCDNTFFTEYEDKELYSNLREPLPPLFLSKINIKNLLYLIYKAHQELIHSKAHIDLFQEEKPELVDNAKEMLWSQLSCSFARLGKYEDLYKYAKIYSDKNIETEKVLYLRELPYTVPIAIQLAIPVAKGINGETINDFTVSDKPFHMLNACVFPLKNTSTILLSSHISGREYDGFAAELKKLPLDEQLEIINYMIFQHSEDFYCNADALKEVSQDEEFLKVCQDRSECDLTKSKIPKIPNLLTMKT